MLPILPALILLLLQGPSNIERLAREGRLPAALEAIHREMDRATMASTPKQDAILASLLATTDPHFSTALFALLQPEKPEPAPKLEPAYAQENGEPIVVGEAPTLGDGFAECRRSRDGPAAIA